MFEEGEFYLPTSTIGDRGGWNRDTVVSWINAGLLDAIDGRRPGTLRPRWKVSRDAWAAFEEKRSAIAEAKARRITRNRGTSAKPRKQHI